MKKLNNYTFFCLIYLTIVACKQNNSLYELIGTYKNADLSNIETIYPILFEQSIIFTDNINDTSFYLKAIDSKSLKNIWVLKVNLHTPKYLYYNLQPYKFKNILVIPCSNEIFAVDLRTGAIIWRTIDDYSGEDFLEGINQFFFRTYYDYKTKKYLIKKININSGHAEIILEQTHKADVKIHCRTPIPVVNNGDTLLFYTCIQQKIESKRTIPFFNIYSQNKKMIIYSDSLKTNFLGQGITKQPMIYENSIILINDNQIVEFDIKSSSIKSNISLPRDMLTSKPLIQDGMLYYPCEDGFLYAIKLNDNNIKWKTKISGTPGHIKISEDKIFVVGGGDGLLHCIDIKNGQLKFSIPEKKSASLFERPLLLINKNKILLSDKNKFYFYQINE